MDIIIDATPLLFPISFPVSWGHVGIIINSLSIDDRIGERSTASFTVRDLGAALSFEQGDPCDIYDDDDNIIFAGFIDSVDIREITPGTGLFHAVKCTDNHYLADKRLAAESYEDKSCGYIASDLLTNYLADEGVTEGEIQDGPELSTCVINYVRVSDALDTLADAAGFLWYIGHDRKLHFIARSTNAAPWEVTTDDMVLDTVGLTEGNPKYRNRQYIRGGKAVTDLQTENRTGDGETKSFAMGFPLAKVPTITVDGGAQTVGIKGIDTGKDWYWSKGDEAIVADTAPANGKAIVVQYYGEYEIIVQATDEDAVADQLAIEGVGTGIVEDIADEPNVTDVTSAVDIALAKLQQYSPHGKSLTFTTRRTGLASGQLAKVTYPAFGLSAAEMLIESVRIRRVAAGTDEFRYAVTATEGPVAGGWSQFFKTLAKIGELTVTDVNIGGGSTLVILKQFSEEYSWLSEMTPTSYTCSICGDGTVCGDGSVVC